jgi:transposase InsO family protein
VLRQELKFWKPLQHPQSKDLLQWPSKTAVALRVFQPAADLATASLVGRTTSIFSTHVSASQDLAVEVLLRPVEFAQYASAEYRQLLDQHGARCSMSRVGDCWDNAVAESFFATLKKELVHRCAFQTRSEAYDAISAYIENYYNAKRRHSAAGNQSPINFELANSGQLAA